MFNAAKKQLGLQPAKLRIVYKNEHLPSHDLHIEQVVVPSYHYKLMCAAQKLQYNYQGRCYLWEYKNALEALPTSVQENKR